MSDYQEAKAQVFELIGRSEQLAHHLADLMMECRRPLTEAESQQHPLTGITKAVGSEVTIIDWPEILRRLKNRH